MVDESFMAFDWRTLKEERCSGGLDLHGEISRPHASPLTTVINSLALPVLGTMWLLKRVALICSIPRGTPDLPFKRAEFIHSSRTHASLMRSRSAKVRYLGYSRNSWLFLQSKYPQSQFNMWRTVLSILFIYFFILSMLYPSYNLHLPRISGSCPISLLPFTVMRHSYIHYDHFFTSHSLLNPGFHPITPYLQLWLRSPMISVLSDAKSIFQSSSYLTFHRLCTWLSTLFMNPSFLHFCNLQFLGLISSPPPPCPLFRFILLTQQLNVGLRSTPSPLYITLSFFF